MEEQTMAADDIARIAQALAHPVRIRILDLLRNEGAYVMHLTNALDRPQANISQHLAVLRDAGLVSDERDGMTVEYRVRDQRVYEILGRLGELASRGPSEPRSTETPPYGLREGRGGRHGRGRCRCPRCRGL
jgi:ArsR family transcriptional regulator